MPYENNFRSAYYKALFVANEKKSEDASFWKRVLEEEVIDTKKLAWCTLKYGVPAVYRSVVWKVLMGILPPQRAIWDFVTKQKESHFADVVRAFSVLLGRRREITTFDAETIARMCVLQSPVPEQRAYEKANIGAEDVMAHVVSIAAVFVSIAESDCDAYYLTLAFLKESDMCKPVVLLSATLYPKINHCSGLLAAHDGELYQHFVSLGVGLDIFAVRWLSSCFALSLSQDCVERLWDKVIGGTFQFAIFATLAILVLNRRRLLQSKTSTAVYEILENLSDLNAEYFINKTMEIRDKLVGPSDPPMPQPRQTT